LNKKLIAIYGSPRKDGNSTVLLRNFIKGAKETGLFDIEEIVLCDLKISPCLEIYKCKGDGICAINDDFQQIYRLIDAADIVALASPVMFYTVSAHTKILMDRCQSFWVRKYVLKQQSKTKDGYFFCVGATKGQKLFDGILMTVKYFFDSFNCELKESVLVRNADEKGDILKYPETLNNAYKLGTSLK
jgi:multimeric flavodoxin WrbA